MNDERPAETKSSEPKSRRRMRPTGNPPAEARNVHGRRMGKTLRRVPAAVVDALLPHLKIDLSTPIAEPARLFERPVRDLRLEIGFGGGEHLVAEALRHAEIGFLGCEPFVNGVAKALQSIAAHDLDNIRVHPGDAAHLIDRLPNRCLGQVDLLYPDPWPKRRHRKRRFVSDAMLRRLARVMRAGAELRFATDIDDYAGWTLVHIRRSSDFDWAATAAEDWLRPWENWSATRYEAKARLHGRRSTYLTFVRRQASAEAGSEPA